MHGSNCSAFASRSALYDSILDDSFMNMCNSYNREVAMDPMSGQTIVSESHWSMLEDWYLMMGLHYIPTLLIHVLITIPADVEHLQTFQASNSTGQIGIPYIFIDHQQATLV